MENETTRSAEGLLEPVHPGSVTFTESILAPLRNNYLYEESKECFTYNSAHLINNATLQKRYAAFRSEKREKGYSEQELEESFGFLLLDDANRARKVGETGLLVGRAKCTTLGDSLKGVYISKYSDCLDLKRWYDGKTGYVVLLKLTKGRVKEVTDNYTQNFTPPTPGFDCHISDQLGAVSSTTSSFLAYERTQYYLYELSDGSRKAVQCPRHAIPFAIVAFSYGKMSTTSESEQKSRDKTGFHYQPWIGQFKIESTVYDVGLQSTSGAWFPAKLPKTVQIDHAIGVSELKRTLPREIFETCIVGEVCIGGKCFNLYDVVSSKAKNDLAQIAHELKEKDMALVIPLEDSGFLVLLHSSHLFSYEDAKSGKAAALQGMFIFPDSRTVPRDAKSHLPNTKASTEVMQVIPALNYAETEMEKCPSDQQGSSQASLEKHLQEYGTLFHTGPLDVPTREASMFPDQYDVPGGFTLISPKWSKETGTRLKSYFDEPCGFTIPIVRALELLNTGRQQRGDDHDDDVYYCISSPEEVPQTDASSEMEVTRQTEAVSDVSDRIAEKTERRKHEHKHLSTEQPQPPMPEGLGKLGTAVVTVPDSVLEYPTSTVSPKLGDVPTENCVSIDTDVKKTSQDSTKGDAGGVCVDLPAKETPIQTSSTSLTTSPEEAGTAVSGEMVDNKHPESTMADPRMKVTQRAFSRRGGRKRKIHWKTLQNKKEVSKKLALESLSLPLVLPVNSSDVPIKDETQTETLHADDTKQRPHSTRRGKGHRRKGWVKDRSEVIQAQDPLLSVSAESSVHDQSVSNESCSSKRDWRSLPRRKRLWNTDTSLKRSLRSDAVKNDKETVLNSSFDDTKQSLSSTPKRKMEGFSLRERYGLKTIITNCGRVFVPHGSDVESTDKRQNEKMHVEMSSDMKAEIIETKSTETMESKGESLSNGKEDLPSKDPVVNEDEDSSDMPNALLSALKILRKLHQNNPAENKEKSMEVKPNETVGSQQSNKDCPVQADVTSSLPRDFDQSTQSDPKVSSPDKTKKKAKHGVYSAISISKLKTVLRRGKKGKSPSHSDSTQSEKDNPEQESKKVRLNSSMDVKHDIIKSDLKDKGTQPMNDEPHHTLTSVELIKQPVSWRGLIQKTSKENGSLNFDTSAPFEIAKHADQQLISSIIGDRVARRRISFEGKARAEKLSTGASLPSDALSLLADLALGASNDKMLTNLAKPGPEALDGVKASSSAESVLHALLRYPAARFKLPPRSPFPESLLATGELILEISKEHSYSQTTSPLSGLSGPSPQVSGLVESPLSLKTGLLLNLPKDAVFSSHQEERGKTEWKHLISPNMPLTGKTKARRSRILRSRRITEKEGRIEVTRIWKDPYDFKFDSKFTNDNVDKTVTRALHGKWNFNLEDTFEDVHLIFHMWIGLFYSKSTSRLFQLDNITALPKGKDVEKIHLDKNAIQNAVSSLNIELSSKEGSSKPVPLSSEILDLSVKTTEPVNLLTLSNEIRSKETVSQSGVKSSSKHEAASEHSPAGKIVSPSPKVKAVMNYRSAVDMPQENSSIADGDNCTDDENDITADCSYAQLLESNSAYNQLCDQASNMRIGIRVLLPKVRNTTNNDASTKVTTPHPKKIGVFHQILKPPLFSKPSALILGRKSFDLGLKNETVAHAVLQKNKKVSEIAEMKVPFKAHRRKDGSPEPAVDGNVDKTSEFKAGDGSSVSIQKESAFVTEKSKAVSDEDSQEGCLMIVDDGNVAGNMTCKTSNQSQTSAAEHKEAAREKEDLKTLPVLQGQANKVDDLRGSLSEDSSVKEHSTISKAKKDRSNMIDSSNETHVEDHIESSNAQEELKPLLYDTNLVDHVDELSDISTDETRVREDNDTFNAKEDLEHPHDLKDHTDTVDEQRDALSDETKVECVESCKSKEELDLKDQPNVVDTSSLVTEGKDTIGGVEEKEGYTAEEIMQEGEKSMEKTSLDGSVTEHETATAVGEVADEFVLELNDDVNSVDMEFSDEDVENKVEGPTVKSSAFINDDHDMKMQKSEARPQTPEEENYALEEFSNVSCSDEEQPVPVQKKQAPAPNSNTFDVMLDEIETKALQQNLVVPQEDLDVCQEESKPTSIIEPFKLGISDSESDDESDSVQQDASEVKGDEDTLVEENETQREVSCGDHVIETHQECLSPKICASLPNSMVDSGKEVVAPRDLRVNKPLEFEVNSMCSTPTQDEITCYPEVNEDNREEGLNRDLYYPVNTARVVHHDAMLPPESPVGPRTHDSTTKPTSDFTGNYEETPNDERRWRRSRNLGTTNFKDKSALIDNFPSEDHFEFGYKLCSTSQEQGYVRKGSSQNDSELFYSDYNVDDSHEYFQGSGEHWDDYQTEELVDHQLYPCENDFSDEPICSKNITSEREFSYKPKKRTRKETDEYCWPEENYKSDPLSLKFPIKVTCNAEYIPKKKSRKSKYTGAFCQNTEWGEEYSSNDTADYNIKKTSCFETYQSKPTRVITVSSLPASGKQQFDWSRYFRREVTSSQRLDVCERDEKFDVPPTSIVTVLDKKGNRVTYSNSPTVKPSFSGCSLNKGLEDSFNQWQEQQRKAESTRSMVDLEYLIFSKEMNRVLKETKSSVRSHCRSNPEPAASPMTVHFTDLSEVESSMDLSKAQQSHTNFKIKVELSDRKGMKEPVKKSTPYFHRLFNEKGNEVEFAGISEITEQCAVEYKSMINDVCRKKAVPRPAKAVKSKYDQVSAGPNPRFCGRVKKDIFINPHDNLKSTMRQTPKIRYRFYILVTSADTFFEETKNLMEIEGHKLVEPDEFDLNDDGLSPLLIILRNEDIAEHICEVPYLLELKKSPSVHFAGIDRPDDVVNLTHQELFAKGGFIVCDELALDTLTLDDMKKVVGILEELEKQGKWKWFVHYRDSRRLRESARSSPEANKKQQFIDWCQKAGIVEVLPYHDCDVISRDRPDYFSCLTRLQIQNASVRFPVFISDTPTEAFGTNGILTLNIYTFSRILLNDTCSVS